MHRLFGKKVETLNVDIGQVGSKMNSRVDDLDLKIKKLDDELKVFKDQLAKTKTAAGKTNIKKRAMQVLKKKRMYESQRDNLSAQTFNLDQVYYIWIQHRGCKNIIARRALRWRLPRIRWTASRPSSRRRCS